ncbi:hypothetical protein BaRGS_00019286 [Batillaria attramentaria]|uniref:Uncharacterized protein n=1 Tax=Batillaria attramentaria TaxID=370345 RepID=A0ABD0KQM3_9CAEN
MTTWEKIPIEVSPDKRVSWCHFSHFSFGDFGRSDILRHWSVTKIMEEGRLFGLRAGLMDYPSIVNDTCTTFELGPVYTFDQALWTVPVGTQFPYKISVELQDVGKTSATLFCRLVNKLDNKTLATYRGKLVYVNRSTRRPVAFPDWFQQKYSTVKTQNFQPLVLPKSAPQVLLFYARKTLKHRTLSQSRRNLNMYTLNLQHWRHTQYLKPPHSTFQVPESAFAYRVTVPADDLDFNKHNNQSSYFRYCCDAAQEMVGVFTGESNQGDLLCVSLWQQDDQPNRIRFVITRKEGIQQPIIFHGSMTFGMTPVRAARL